MIYNRYQGVDSNAAEELTLVAYKEDITKGLTFKQHVKGNWCGAVVNLLETTRDEHIDFTYNLELFMKHPGHKETVVKSITSPVLNNMYYKVVKEINNTKDQ